MGSHVVRQANPYCVQLLIVLWVNCVVFLLVYFTSSWAWLRVPTAFWIPGLLLHCIYLATVLYRIGPSPLPKAPFAGGMVLYVGGVLFDAFATLLKTPDLFYEGNPVARGLLDSGFSHKFVIAYGVLTQALLAFFVCVLWGAFLKHKGTFIAQAKDKSKHSFAKFLKAAWGGADLSWRQLLFPIKISELPKAYYLTWSLAPFLIIGGLYRWYLGLEWIKGFHLPDGWTVAITLLVLCAVHTSWLWYEYTRDQSQHSVP